MITNICASAETGFQLTDIHQGMGCKGHDDFLLQKISCTIKILHFENLRPHKEERIRVDEFFGMTEEVQMPKLEHVGKQTKVFSKLLGNCLDSRHCVYSNFLQPTEIPETTWLHLAIPKDFFNMLQVSCFRDLLCRQ